MKFCIDIKEESLKYIEELMNIGTNIDEISLTKEGVFKAYLNTDESLSKIGINQKNEVNYLIVSIPNKSGCIKDYTLVKLRRTISDSDFVIAINLIDYMYLYNFMKDYKLHLLDLFSGVKALEMILDIVRKHTGMDRDGFKYTMKNDFDFDIEVEFKHLFKRHLGDTSETVQVEL